MNFESNFTANFTLSCKNKKNTGMSISLATCAYISPNENAFKMTCCNYHKRVNSTHLTMEGSSLYTIKCCVPIHLSLTYWPLREWVVILKV